MSLVIVALLLALAAAAAGTVYAVRRGLALWRDVKAFSREFGNAIDDLAPKLDRLDAFEPPDLERAGESFVRLHRSREQLSILLRAVGRVQEQWAGLVGVYPRK